MSPRLTQLLLHPADAQPEDLSLLSSSGMSGWVASRLPPGHETAALLQPARLTLLARQMVLRRSLSALLAALHGEGVDALLLKGFMLAEFAYKVPGTRPYGDIDLLVRPQDLGRLLQVASECGWWADDLARRPQDWTHEMVHLYSPDRQIRLDVHRYVAPWIGGSSRQVERLTRAVWNDAVVEELDGVPVRRPSWPDAAMTLMLGRCWSGDRSEYKPADYTDLEALMSRPGVTPERLSNRALELGAERTWRAFLAGCNPWTATFEFDHPNRARRINRAASRDGAALPRALRRRHLGRLPVVFWNMLMVVPDVLAARLSLGHARRRSVGPQALVLQMDRSPSRRPGGPPPGPETVMSVIRGVRRLTQLLYPRSSGSCVPRSLATYRALRRRGYPAVYVSGVRRGAAGEIEGHAWVEGPDGVLDSYGEPLNRLRFQTVFEVRGAGPTAAAAAATRESGPARTAD